jgi:hypothetical protein
LCIMNECDTIVTHLPKPGLIGSFVWWLILSLHYWNFRVFFNAKENWIGLWRSSMTFLSFWCVLVNSLSVTFGKTKKGEQLGYLCLEGNGLCEVLCCKLVVVYNFFSLYWIGLRVVNEKFGEIHLVLTMGFSYLV